MNHEIFDIVDAEDRVTGQVPRAEVHRRGLPHRAIHVQLFNARGEVFIQRRSFSKDNAPGCWDSACSGHLDAGEDYRGAALRELGEELGLEPPPAVWPVFKHPACADTGWEFVWVYRGVHDGPFRLHPEEIIDGRWVEPGALDRELIDTPDAFARSFCLLWRRFRAIHRKGVAPVPIALHPQNP